MKGTKWLSEAVSLENIRNGVMNLIDSPTGSGKSVFALYTLPRLASNRNKVLYLIDTINGREQLLKEENTMPCSDGWIDRICRRIIDFGTDEVFENNKIVIMTYAKFGTLADRFTDFGFHFDVIVCDEIHSAIEMANYERKHKYNYPQIALDRIKPIIYKGKVKVVGLTATPRRAEREFCDSVYYIPVDKDIREYETFEDRQYTNLDALIPLLDKTETGIIYTGHITKMREIVRLSHQQGINAVAVWSVNNKENPMTADQHRARQHILDKALIPPEYNLLVINKSCETSITIGGDIDYMIINSQEEDRRVQVRGRLRGDLDIRYTLDYNANPSVPPEYMGIKLFKEDKQKLASLFKLRNSSGNIVGWNTVEDRLIDSGYAVTNGRYQDRRYSIITL